MIDEQSIVTALREEVEGLHTQTRLWEKIRRRTAPRLRRKWLLPIGVGGAVTLVAVLLVTTYMLTVPQVKTKSESLPSERLYLLDHGFRNTPVVRIYDTVTSMLLTTIKTGPNAQIAVDDERERLYVVESNLITRTNSLRVFSTDDWTEVTSVTLPDHVSRPLLFFPQVALSPDGGQLFISMWKVLGDSQAEAWTIVVNTELLTVEVQQLPGCANEQILPGTGGAVVIACPNGQILSANLKTTMPVLSTQISGSSPYQAGAARLPSGAVISVNRGGEIHSYAPDRNAVSFLFKMDLPEGWGVIGNAVTVPPDGNTLFVGVGSEANTSARLSENILVYEVGTWLPTGRLSFPEPVLTIAPSLDGKVLYGVTGGNVINGSTMYGIDVATGDLILTIRNVASSGIFLVPTQR